MPAVSYRASARILLTVAALIAAAALVIRAWHGPFAFLMPVTSPMNPESIFAAALVLVIMLAPGTPKDAELAGTFTRRDWCVTSGLAVILIAVAWPSVFVQFVADDYAHVLTVSKADSAFVSRLFTVPATDHFFRPIAMLWYWLEFQWAGVPPVAWHFGGVLLHVLNAFLVYTLCRRLGLATPWAAFAAACFGVHGTRPEAMTWVAARFDLLATSFVLAGLLFFLGYVRRPTHRGLAFMLAATLLGLLSKESAYAIPLLLAALPVFRHDLRKRAAYRAIAACTVLTALTFAYRWFLLRGIGGYQDVQGRSTILFVNVRLFFKALFLRLPAVLVFPLNWTDALGWMLNVLLLAAIVVLIFAAWRTKRSALAGLGVALTLAAALPVQHILLIGPDLEKSRVIYLGSVGFSLFLAAALAAFPKRTGYAAAAVLLAFQAAALRHNLSIWERVGHEHVQACDTISSVRTDTIAVGMPNTHDGVYMLKTGLPECREIRHGIPARTLHLVDTPTDAARLDPAWPLFVWNDPESRIERVR